MKLTNLIWVLALASAAAGCNSGSPLQGCDVDPNTGQCSTEGGECGPISDACTNADDAAVYADLVYTNGDGEVSMGPDASSAIGSDCIFGSMTSIPPVEGCGSFAFDVLGCFPNCPDCGVEEPPAACGQACTTNAECGTGFACLEDGTCTDIVQAAAICVAQCTQDTTAEIAPPGLSNACVSCTGETVACGAAFCTDLCVADTNAPACIECRCNNNCIPCFDICSGLPGDDECG